jgi:transcriptional regulator with XRE-family HTH domain
MKVRSATSPHKPKEQTNVPQLPPTVNEALANLAEQIRIWRKRHEMTQADLAMRSGISVSFISMIERGERSPSYDTLVQIGQALDIPLSELFRAGDEPPKEDGYFRRLVEFAREARLSRKQVEQLISVGRAMFELSAGVATSALPAVSAPPGRRCSVPGCGRPLLARGLCPSHYRRKLRQKRGKQG